MTHFRISGIAAAFCFCLLFFILPFSAGQDISLALKAEDAADLQPVEPLTIKLDVEEVRLDVVVLDNKGRPITDLTAADFEIYQNRLPQDVISSVYIKNQAEAAAAPAASRKGAPKLPPLPGAALKKEDVRRTIVFVVDNLSMEPEHLHHAKTSIKRFMERQMQPDDLVAVIRTSYGNSAVNFFSSDKRQLTARVDGIPFAKPRYPDPDPEDQSYANKYVIKVSPKIEEALNARIHGNQISTVSYSIRALKDMPGRKILFFMSSMPTIVLPPAVVFMRGERPSSVAETMSLNFGNPPENLSIRYGSQLKRLADEALRAGVVVHTLDARGLAAPTLDWRGDEHDYLGRQVGIPETNYANGLNGLSYSTGGIFVQNSNFFVDGVGREANNMISGYYLLSYAPPPSTFDVSRRNIFHRIEVKVKRRGAVVHTRDGFYGRTESETDSGTSAHPLQDAVFSPFKHTGLDVNIAAGYIKDAKAGYIVRAWIHIDPKDVKIVETEDGGAQIDLETVCLTSDINGHIHDFRHVKYTFGIKPENKSENLAWIRKHGIRFSVLLPVKKPGSYTVRAAVQDMESGKTGSAWQPVEISDLTKKGLALSDVFIITSADDLNWMLSDATEQFAEGLFFPVFQAEEVQSPALRTYMPGDGFQTLAVLYNAEAKAVSASDITIQSVLYKDGAEYQRGEPAPLAAESAGSPDGILILRKFTIGSDMPPGDYVLQMISTDRKNSKKEEGVAAQTLNFTVKEEP